MKSLHVRNISTGVLEGLKRRAEYHHRSLQGELHALLEDAVKTIPRREESRLSLITVDTGEKTSWHREEMYDDSGR